MNDNRPKWYGRAAKDPFRSGGFTPKMADSVRQAIHRPHSRPKGIWRIAGGAAAVLAGILLYGVYEKADISPVEPAEWSPSILEEKAKTEIETLVPPLAINRIRGMMRPGLGPEEIKRLIGGQFVNLTGDVLGKESAWRYDYGVKPGHELPAQASLSGWADSKGLEAGEVYGQLLIRWQEGKAAEWTLAYKGLDGKTRYEELRNTQWRLSVPAKEAGELPGSLQADKEARLLLKQSGNKGIWAVGSRLWQSINAGKDWLDRSPSGFTSQMFHFAYALDGEHAWVVERPQAASAEEEKDALSRWSLLHTSDGGRSWERQAFPAPAHWPAAGVNTASDFYFIDDRTGYALISSDPAGGPVHMVLLATEDGGRTWEPRTTMERGRDQGNPSSLVFRNAKEGWISFHNASGREPVLYRTQDGGVTWRPVKWELPPEGDDVLYTAETTPQFFGKDGREGILPITYRKKDNSVTGTVWYRSSDGGDSWSRIPSDAPVGYSDGPAITGPTLPILGDPDHLWLLDGEQGRLYRSVDGGKRWERILDSPALQLASVIFSDARNGLLVTAGQVMQTSDGGRTWKAVAPSK